MALKFIMAIPDSRNELAEQLAIEKKLTGTVGSDFHQLQDLAACSVEMECLPENEQELARRIREKQFYVKIYKVMEI